VKSKTRAEQRYPRRKFLKELSSGAVLMPALGGASAPSSVRGAPGQAALQPATPLTQRIRFPRSFADDGLRTVAFPLGGIGTGSISLGGRGQLRDWEIFNRPDKGNSPAYCFPAVWVKVNGRKPVSRVLEAQIAPPFEGPSGLGSNNVPGLPRLKRAIFTGATPFARIEFQDSDLPVQISLEAFNPLVPLDVEASGIPAAILRYSVRNASSKAARVGVSFSLENPVGREGRRATFREETGISGLYMDDPFLAVGDPLKGSLVLAVIAPPQGSVSYLRGWKRTQWWDGALAFWDDFTADGALDSGSSGASPVASLAVTQPLPVAGTAVVTFLIAWHFPNRTPARCGWKAPEGEEKTQVGNWYTVRFRDAWDAASYVARELPALEARTRRFYSAIESSTLPGAVLDAATANLLTLKTNTAFRTADGEFHGFEGCNDHAGCCHGSCTHVWNYEQATAFVFPSLSRSLRESEFLRNTNEQGRMGFRSFLPDGKQIWDKAAADGQMGCLIRLYRDWNLGGDTTWLRRIWPQAKRALEFAWIEHGWDSDTDGVMEGVQHNTYDVEFFGPNPLCGVLYLGALRAGEKMAKAVGDHASADRYRRLFDAGSRWIDAHLFNGEYYIQKILPRAADEIADGLRVGLGAGDPTAPDYQLGDACLVDQLLGQCVAHVAGLGYLLDRSHVRQTLRSIYRYNFKADLSRHESVQRTYALGDEAGVLVASYPSGQRPPVPFPYFAEVWTGLEYQLAALLIYEDMLAEALKVIEATRLRHDGVRRNPWNEPECGHHYARAMSSWAVLLAWSGFHYSAVEQELALLPRGNAAVFRSFWSAPGAWGEFFEQVTGLEHRVTVEVVEGKLEIQSLRLRAVSFRPRTLAATLGRVALEASWRDDRPERVVSFRSTIEIAPQHPLEIVLASRP
jgi:non-lysosomal glucosylceramidase